jgi:hypothetical protein
VFHGERSVFWEVIVSVILRKTVYMYFCPLRNGSRDRAISPYSCKIVEKKKVLHTFSHTGIYCSSDRICTGCLLQYIYENSTVNVSALCNSCENMACCSSKFIMTVLFAGCNIHYVIEQFVLCIQFSSVPFTLHPTP